MGSLYLAELSSSGKWDDDSDIVESGRIVGKSLYSASPGADARLWFSLMRPSQCDTRLTSPMAGVRGDRAP